jgi:hypothetical protein
MQLKPLSSRNSRKSTMTPVIDATDGPVPKYGDLRTRVPTISEEFIAFSTQPGYVSMRYREKGKQIFLPGLINSRRINYFWRRVFFHSSNVQGD